MLFLLNAIQMGKRVDVAEFRSVAKLIKEGHATFEDGRLVLTDKGKLEWMNLHLEIGSNVYKTAAQAILQIGNLQGLTVDQFETIWKDQAIEVDGLLFFDERWVMELGELDPLWIMKA